MNAEANTKAVETSIPRNSISNASKNGITSLTISNPVAELTFDKNAMMTIAGNTTDDVKISVAKVDVESLHESIRGTVGDRPVYDFSVTCRDTTISKFAGDVEVTVPYTPKEGEDINAIVIYYINDKGELETIRDCYYDSATGKVRFRTNHFSKYTIGYNKIVFKDVEEGAPYYHAVSFLAARGITNGTGNDCYSPDAKLNRAQLLVMIMRTYGFVPDDKPSDNSLMRK